MSIELQTTATLNISSTVNDGSNDPIDVPKPSGLADGDFVTVNIGLLSSDGVSRSPRAWTLPAGFALIQQSPLSDDGSINRHLMTAGKVITDASSEPSTWAFVHTGGGTWSIAATAGRWSGVDNTNPVYGVSSNAGASSDEVAFPLATALAAGDVYVGSMMARRALTVSYDSPMLVVASEVGGDSSNTSNRVTASHGYFLATAAGNVEQTATLSQSREWRAHTFFLQAATASGPTITTQPTSQTVTAPASATFTVAATGEGALSYQWQYREGEEGTPAIVDFGTGGTTTSFNTGVNTISRTGWQFRCLVTDDNDTTESNWATLTVNPAAAPILTAPTATNIGQTTATPRVTTDTANGDLYYVLYPASQENASQAQVIAGEDANDDPAISADDATVTEAGVVTFPQVTGLSPGTSYKISYVHVGDPDGGA